jgi:hypothetical protein
MKKINMIGERFGKLKVLSEVKNRNKNGHIKYLCECECGEIKEVFGTHLRENKIVSCGCKNKVNGVSGDMWYKIINSGIKTRIKRSNMDCDITKEYINQLFENQKGRCALSGLEITLPKTWRDRKYTASLDRINSDIGYLKNNIQWVHKHINVMKNIFTQNMFIFMCKEVSKNIKDFDNFNITELEQFKWGMNEKYRKKIS